MRNARRRLDQYTRRQNEACRKAGLQMRAIKASTTRLQKSSGKRKDLIAKIKELKEQLSISLNLNKQNEERLKQKDDRIVDLENELVACHQTAHIDNSNQDSDYVATCDESCTEDVNCGSFPRPTGLGTRMRWPDCYKFAVLELMGDCEMSPAQAAKGVNCVLRHMAKDPYPICHFRNLRKW